MTIWFRSDDHFHHANAIKYCNRPFGPVAEMDDALLKSWTDMIGPDDLVYYLGDLVLGDQRARAELVKRLTGRIVLIRGNHDPTVTGCRAMGIQEVHNRLAIELDGIKIVLQHRPPRPDARLEEDLLLCGHAHERWQYRGTVRPNRLPHITINVGVDQWGFKAISWEQVKAFYSTVLNEYGVIRWPNG